MSVPDGPPDFSEFAANRLNTKISCFDEKSAEAPCFNAARDSALEIMRWMNGKRNANGDQLIIQGDYVQLWEPNALAEEYRGVHFVAIHQTLVESIIEFALFAFTQKYIFPKLGDVGVETSPEPRDGVAPGLLLLQKYLNDDHVSNKDRYRVPNDKTRQLFAIYLGVFMVRFVWFHEMAHCLNGHVLYAQDSGLATALYEVDTGLSISDLKTRKTENRMRATVRRGLEFDADNTAFLALCRVQLLGGETIDSIKSLDLKTRLELNIFAAYAITWLFEEYNNFKMWELSGTHPSPYDRVMNISGSAMRILAKEKWGFNRTHKRVAKQFNKLIYIIPSLNQLNRLGEDTTHPDYSFDSRLVLESMLEDYRFS